MTFKMRCQKIGVSTLPHQTLFQDGGRNAQLCQGTPSTPCANARFTQCYLRGWGGLLWETRYNHIGLRFSYFRVQGIPPQVDTDPIMTHHSARRPDIHSQRSDQRSRWPSSKVRIPALGEITNKRDYKMLCLLFFSSPFFLKLIGTSKQ